jgi:MOSC domain-containing protein YiiM
MHTPITERTALEMEQSLAEVLASPVDDGPLEAIFVRRRKNERSALEAAELSPQGGIHGDRWVSEHWQKLPDGRPDPRSQVSLMNARILRFIAGSEEAMSLAGDNLIIDLQLSEALLPAGSRLRIGTHVILELTAQSHTGCGKFARRFGQEARKFINGPRGARLHLRGRYARVVEGGTIRVGDRVTKV